MVSVLALAGLKSLNLDARVKKIFSIKKFLPQLVRESSQYNVEQKMKKSKNILNKINDERTEICAIAERSLLKTLGGDCDTALGCYAELKNRKIKL